MPRQAARIGDRGRHLTDEPDRFAARRTVVDDNRCGLAGDEKRLRRRFASHAHAERVAHPFDDAFHVEEVDVARASGPVLGCRVAGPRHAERARLAVGREPGPDLEEAHVAATVTPVVRDGVDQSRQQQRTKRVELR